MPRSPAIGTNVKIINGAGQGRSGLVWSKGGGVVDVMCVGELIKGVPPDFLEWRTVIPPEGTKVTISHIEGLENTVGTVAGYANIATLHKVETSLGTHYGLRAALVQTDEYGTKPILPDNLLWDRASYIDAEHIPLPPAGRRTGDLPESALPLPKRSVITTPEPTPLRTAKYQLCLSDPLSGRIVREEPTPAAAVVFHIAHGDIISVVLPHPGGSGLPRGWYQLNQGGFMKEMSPNELVPLGMSCPECGVGFPTENASQTHFEREHIGVDPHLTLAGTIEPEPATASDPNAALPSFMHRAYSPTGNSRTPIPTSSAALPGMSPSWFLLAKPRRDSASPSYR